MDRRTRSQVQHGMAVLLVLGSLLATSIGLLGPGTPTVRADEPTPTPTATPVDGGNGNPGGGGCC